MQYDNCHIKMFIVFIIVIVLHIIIKNKYNIILLNKDTKPNYNTISNCNNNFIENYDSYKKY